MTAATAEMRGVALRLFPDRDWSVAEHVHGAFHHVLLLPQVVLRISGAGLTSQRMPVVADLLSELAGGDLCDLIPRPLDLRAESGWSGLLTTRLAGTHPLELPPEQVLPSLLALLERVHSLNVTSTSTVRPTPWDWCGGDRFPNLVKEELAPRLPAPADEVAVRAVAAVLDLDRAEGSLVHGDFGPGNVLCTGTTVTGLIDWDHAGLGDPAIDYGTLISTYGRQLLAPHVEKGTLDRAERYRATGALRLAAAGFLNDRPDLLTTGLRNFAIRVSERSILVE